jgi:diguanylate cyclase (GGDEF)-like protein
LETWTKAAWKSLFFPGGVLLLTVVILLETGWATIPMPIITFLYYGGLLVGLLLSWRFHSTRIFFAVLVLFLTQQAVFFLTRSVPLHGSGRVALQAAVFLVPLNFVLLSLSQERGFALNTLGSGLILLFVQSTVVAALARVGQDYPRLPHTTNHAGVSPLASPYVLAAFGISALVLLIRFMLCRKPTESALFWSLASFFLAVSSAGIERTAVAYYATSTLILALSIIETSYLLAYHDDLTSLPSRRAFKDTLMRIAAPYSIAMVDIDHFKRFNDTYGHDTGDQVLRLVSASLARVSGGGRAYRCGGEEFAIVFAGKTIPEVLGHLEQLRATIESSSFRVRGSDRRQLPRGPDRRSRRSRGRARAGAAIRQPGNIESRSPLSVTVSAGVADCTQEKIDPERVVQAADKALYRAKAEGRNRIETASSARRRPRTTAAGIA